MVFASSVSCEKCGAALKPEPGAEQVTCEYCGTTSIVERPRESRVRTEPRDPQPAAQSRSALGKVLGVFLGIGLLFTLASAGLKWLASQQETPSAPRRSPAVSPPTAATVESSQAPAAVPPPQTAADTDVRSSFKPLVFDFEQHGRQGFVVGLFVTGHPNNTQHFATFDADGIEQARSEPVEVDDVAVHAIVGNRLIVASRMGQLTAFGMPAATQHWTTALGERVYAICEAKSAEQLLLVLKDDRRLTVDLTTGRQSPTREYCKIVAAIEDHGRNPRDRHDYTAPRGIEAYECGGVRVMGSETYTVPDPCLAQAHVDTDRLPGINAHRLWKVDKDWLMFGVKKPGITIPMVGLLRRGKVVWSSVTPADDPLNADDSPPYRMALAGDNVVVDYRIRKTSKGTVTAFAIADGTRRWTTPLEVDLEYITAVNSPGRLLAQSRAAVTILDSADGHVIRTVGQLR